MKKLIIAAAALMVSIAAYGQGQVVINNRLTPPYPDRFVLSTDAAGTSSVDTSYTVNMLGGPAGAAVSALVPLDPASTTMRGAAGTAGAGYLVQPPTGTYTVPGVAGGGNAEIVLRVTGGVLGTGTQDFGPFTVNGLGGGTITPPNLAFNGAMVINAVPEPTTLALGALGLGALLAIRRRK
jgi:MYXO-CTERM domain-containing protein